MVHGSQNRGSWASWGPTIIFSEKKSPYLNNLSLDHKKMSQSYGHFVTFSGWMDSLCLWILLWIWLWPVSSIPTHVSPTLVVHTHLVALVYTLLTTCTLGDTGAQDCRHVYTLPHTDSDWHIFNSYMYDIHVYIHVRIVRVKYTCIQILCPFFRKCWTQAENKPAPYQRVQNWQILKIEKTCLSVLCSHQQQAERRWNCSIDQHLSLKKMQFVRHQRI